MDRKGVDMMNEGPINGLDVVYLGEMSQDLKHDINRFLWPVLPPWMTLGEAENVAVDMYEQIALLWERRPPSK